MCRLFEGGQCVQYLAIPNDDKMYNNNGRMQKERGLKGRRMMV
jgi:hypothetical protein